MKRSSQASATMSNILLQDREKILGVVSREEIDDGEEQVEDAVCFLPIVQWKASAGLENEQGMTLA